MLLNRIQKPSREIAMRAAIYARYSSSKQRETSIVDQKRNCVNYAEREGHEVVALFADEAVSGSRKDREQYNLMQQAATNKEYDILLVDDLSRLSRDEVEMKMLLRRMQFDEIDVVGVTDGYNSKSKGHKIQAGVKGLMNDIYLDDLKEKVHRGLSGQIHRGYSAGGKPYGYDKSPDYDPVKKDAYGRAAVIGINYMINEEKAETVRQIFTWYADGWDIKRIVNELNKLGIPAPRAGKVWRYTSLQSGKKSGLSLIHI